VIVEPPSFGDYQLITTLSGYQLVVGEVGWLGVCAAKIYTSDEAGESPTTFLA